MYACIICSYMSVGVYAVVKVSRTIIQAYIQVVCMYELTCMHLSICQCTCVSMYECMYNVCMWVRIYVCMYVCMYVCTLYFGDGRYGSALDQTQWTITTTRRHSGCTFCFTNNVKNNMHTCYSFRGTVVRPRPNNNYVRTRNLNDYECLYNQQDVTM